MQNPFWNSAGPRFIDKNEILALARGIAERIAADHPEVRKILLFGSFARDDYGARSDLDLLLVLCRSDKPAGERTADYMDAAAAYPTDILAYTEEEIESGLRAGNPFIAGLLRDAVQLYP